MNIEVSKTLDSLKSGKDEYRSPYCSSRDNAVWKMQDGGCIKYSQLLSECLLCEEFNFLKTNLMEAIEKLLHVLFTSHQCDDEEMNNIQIWLY